MGTITIYDSATGISGSVTLEIQANVLAGDPDGRPKYYVTMTTGSKNPDGGTIPMRIIQDAEFDDDLTAIIKAELIELFKDIVGRPGEYTSSSSSGSSMVSSQSSGKSSSSSSSRLEGTSSSSISSSASTPSSASSSASSLSSSSLT